MPAHVHACMLTVAGVSWQRTQRRARHRGTRDDTAPEVNELRGGRNEGDSSHHGAGCVLDCEVEERRKQHWSVLGLIQLRLCQTLDRLDEAGAQAWP